MAPAGIRLRVMHGLKRGFLYLFSSIFALLIFAVLSLNLPWCRNFVRQQINHALSDTFSGQVLIDRIGVLRLDVVGGIDAHILDSKGQRVIVVRGLRVQSNWPTIVSQLVRRQPLAIKLTPLSVDHVEVVLIDDGQGSPTLVSAFSPRHPKPPSSEKSQVSIAIDHLVLAHVWAHGSLASLALIDTEVAGLGGAFYFSDRGLSIRLVRAALHARALPGDIEPNGSLTAEFVLPSADTIPPHGAADFRGFIASSDANVHVQWKGRELSAHLLAPRIPPEVIRQHLASSRVARPTSLEARVHGTWPTLALDSRVTNEAATVDIHGQLQAADTTRISCSVTASQVNLGPLLGAESTRLNLAASAIIEVLAAGAIHGTYRVRAEPGQYGSYETPRLTTEGQLDQDTKGTISIKGSLDVEESGAPVHGNYELVSPRGRAPILQASLATHLNNPRRLAREIGMRMMGDVRASAELDLLTRRVTSHANVTLGPLAHGDTQLQKIAIRVSAIGRLDDPQLHVSINAQDVRAAQHRFKTVLAEASGTTRRFKVEATTTSFDGHERLALETYVRAEKALVFDSPRVEFVTTQDGPVTAQAERISTLAGAVRVEDFRLAGAGNLSVTGRFGSRDVDSRFTADQLDVAKLSRLAGVKFAQHGTVTLQGSIKGRTNNISGHVQGQLRKLSFAHLTNGNLDFDLRADDQTLNGTLDGSLGPSRMRARFADLRVPQANNAADILEGLRGSLEFEGDLSLEQLGGLLQSVGVPIETASGQAQIDLRVQSEEHGSQGPTLHATLKTQRLRVVELRTGTSDVKSPSEAREAAPRVLEGVDVALELDLDPNSNAAQGHVTLFDQRGPLIELDARTKVPSILSSHLLDELQTLPFKLSVHVPERALEKLPQVVRPSVVRGALTFDLDAEGTLLDPRGTLRVSVRRLQSREGRNYVDAQVETRYDQSGGNVEAFAHATRGGAAELHTAWKGNLIQRLRNSADPLELQSDLVVRQFPVGIVPAIQERQIRGPMSGEVHLRGLGRDAHLQARVDGSGLSVNRIKLSGLQAALTADNSRIIATVDAAEQGGSVHAEFDSACTWGTLWLPKVDPHARLSLRARQFPLATVSPFLMEYVSTLEGVLNADISAQLEDNAPRISGAVTLAEGVIQVPEIGQRFSDISAKVTIRDGDIQLSSLSARGITGRVTAQASAKLSGTQLIEAAAHVDIRKSEKLPVTFEGVMVGDAWGHVDLSYRNKQASDQQGATTDIRVDVPQLNLKMPETARASVQELEPAPDIRIGARRADGKFVEIPLQPLASASAEGEPPRETHVVVHLGNSVWVERDRQAKVQLSGDIELTSGTKSNIRGRIELRGGTLDVSGKQFEIERGVVSFEGSDPSNPTVTATARWDSPAGYAVYADYAGTVKDGKLNLHSDPSLTQDEILSLLLFGAPDGSIASSGNSNGSIGNIVNGNSQSTNSGSNSSGPTGAGAAMSVAGGTATRGLNRAISDVTNLDVSTRIDTSTGSARPELVVQLTPRLTTRVTRALGEPVPGESPDRTFLTLELRLKRSWSLSAIVGDHGASTLDLIWRKRY